MNETIKLILSLSLSGSILAALIFAVKPLIKHKLSKSIQYYIWIVVIFRMILPFSFEGSVMNNVFYGEQPSRIINTQITDDAGDSTVNVPREYIIRDGINSNIQQESGNTVYSDDTPSNRYFKDTFNQYILYIWIIGVIIVAAVNLIGYARFSKHIKQTNKPAASGEYKILTDLLKGQYNVRLMRNPFVTTPMLLGILTPYIIIPDTDFDEKQLKNIFIHEIYHLKRFDIGIKWLIMIAASIHWFNPFMYFIKKEINFVCELACDEEVIKNLTPAENKPMVIH